MNAGLIGGAVLLLLILLAVLWVPLRRRAPAVADAEQCREQDVAIYRERLAELEADRLAGNIDDGRFEELTLELQRRLLDEAGSSEASGSGGTAPGSWPLSLLLSLLLVPLALVLYDRLGAREDLAVSVKLQRLAETSDREEQAGALADLVEGLARRVAAEPDNLQNRYLLARSYLELQRLDDALAQYRELLRRQSDEQPRIMAEYAQLRFFASGRKLDQEGERLLARVLEIEPGNTVALGVLGIAAYERKDFEAAIRYWERVLALTDPGPGQESLKRGIASARGQLGLPPAAATVVEEQAVPGGDIQVRVLVEIAPGLRQELDGSEPVFVFARDPGGPPMPLAVARLRVADLPILVKLDDSMAMTPMARLSQASEVDLQARVALSGQPQAASGDLQARPLKVVLAEQEGVLRLLIEERVP